MDGRVEKKDTESTIEQVAQKVEKKKEKKPRTQKQIDSFQRAREKLAEKRILLKSEKAESRELAKSEKYKSKKTKQLEKIIIETVPQISEDRIRQLINEEKQLRKDKKLESKQQIANAKKLLGIVDEPDVDFTPVWNGYN